jgi:hypothetical protein
MNIQLENNIKEFLTDYRSMFNEDSWGLADYYSFLETAISLLKETIEEKK